jgi:prepilin-type N-terminal cleavage/methylation domain-containing protein
MKHLKTLRSKIAAFTLIELLVVISIIAVLASLALPAITGALVKGQIAQTTSNYRQLYILTQSATLDNQQAGGSGCFPGDSTANNGTNWATNLIPSYCSSNTFNNLASVQGQLSNTLVFNGTPATNDPGQVFLSVAGISGSTLTYSGSGPYGTKGGSFVTVGGSAVSFVGTNSPALTNGVTNASLTGTAL